MVPTCQIVALEPNCMEDDKKDAHSSIADSNKNIGLLMPLMSKKVHSIIWSKDCIYGFAHLAQNKSILPQKLERYSFLSFLEQIYFISA